MGRARYAAGKIDSGSTTRLESGPFIARKAVPATGSRWSASSNLTFNSDHLVGADHNDTASNLARIADFWSRELNT